jgi:hypothetical protein
MAGLRLDGLDNDVIAQTCLRHAQNGIIVDKMRARYIRGWLEWTVVCGGRILSLNGSAGEREEKKRQKERSQVPRTHADDLSILTQKRLFDERHRRVFEPVLFLREILYSTR